MVLLYDSIDLTKIKILTFWFPFLTSVLLESATNYEITKKSKRQCFLFIVLLIVPILLSNKLQKPIAITIIVISDT